MHMAYNLVQKDQPDSQSYDLPCIQRKAASINGAILCLDAMRDAIDDHQASTKGDADLPNLLPLSIHEVFDSNIFP